MKITLDQKKMFTLLWMLVYCSVILSIPSYVIHLSFSQGVFPAFIVGFFMLSALSHFAVNKSLNNKVLELIEDPFSLGGRNYNCGTLTVWMLLISFSLVVWTIIFNVLF